MNYNPEDVMSEILTGIGRRDRRDFREEPLDRLLDQPRLRQSVHRLRFQGGGRARRRIGQWASAAKATKA